MNTTAVNATTIDLTIAGLTLVDMTADEKDSLKESVVAAVAEVGGAQFNATEDVEGVLLDQFERVVPLVVVEVLLQQALKASPSIEELQEQKKLAKHVCLLIVTNHLLGQSRCYSSWIKTSRTK